MITLYKIDTHHKMHRFYHMRIEPTLFGNWALIREWGRIENSAGQSLHVWYETEELARAALQNLEMIKRRKGYSPTLMESLEAQSLHIFHQKP